MVPEAHPRTQLTDRRAEHAVRYAFLMVGLAGASWAAIVPMVKKAAQVDDGRLGALLLCLGVGSIFFMPLAGALAARSGCRCVIAVAGVGLIIALPLLASLTAVPSLAAALVFLGASLSSIECAANIQAADVEQASGRTMMSGFHATFSVGGILGAGGASGLLSLGASPFVTEVATSACCLALLILAMPGLMSQGTEKSEPAFALPKGSVLFVGTLCFVAFLAEGSVLDWSAVFLTSVRHMPASQAGLGYAVFAAVMATCRLTGDRIVDRFGGPAVAAGGAFCAAVGFLITMTVPSWQVTTLAYGLVGLGCANIVPVLYSSLRGQRVMSQPAAIAGITTLGYIGILAGPAVIGLVAGLTDLTVAFALLALALVAAAVAARSLRPLFEVARTA